jgi:hypothetical protein
MSSDVKRLAHFIVRQSNNPALVGRNDRPKAASTAACEACKRYSNNFGHNCRIVRIHLTRGYNVEHPLRVDRKVH